MTESEFLVEKTLQGVLVLEKCLPLLCLLMSRRFRRGEYTSFSLKMLTVTETLLLSVLF